MLLLFNSFSTEMLVQCFTYRVLEVFLSCRRVISPSGKAILPFSRAIAFEITQAIECRQQPRWVK